MKVALPGELPSHDKSSLPAIPQRASIAIRDFFRGLRSFSPVNEGTVSSPLRFAIRFARRVLFVGHNLSPYIYGARCYIHQAHTRTSRA